jgi:hypothetical protein
MASAGMSTTVRIVTRAIQAEEEDSGMSFKAVEATSVQLDDSLKCVQEEFEEDPFFVTFWFVRKDRENPHSTDDAMKDSPAHC